MKAAQSSFVSIVCDFCWRKNEILSDLNSAALHLTLGQTNIGILPWK
jgi:hypothetical protein